MREEREKNWIKGKVVFIDEKKKELSVKTEYGTYSEKRSENVDNIAQYGRENMRCVDWEKIKDEKDLFTISPRDVVKVRNDDDLSS